MKKWMSILLITVCMGAVSSTSMAETSEMQGQGMDGALEAAISTEAPTHAKQEEITEMPLKSMDDVESESSTAEPDVIEPVENMETSTPLAVDADNTPDIQPTPQPTEAAQPTIAPTNPTIDDKQDELEAVNATEPSFDGEDGVTPEPTEDAINQPDETELPEETVQVPVEFSVRWTFELDAEKKLLVDNEVKLKADNEQDFVGVHLQWQVATKTQSQLKEDEEEWVRIAGETDATLAFVPKLEMNNWRWRLQVIQEDGNSQYSDEMVLPKDIRKLLQTVKDAVEETPVPQETLLPEEMPVPQETLLPEETLIPEDALLPEESVDTSLEMEAGQKPMPWATITFVAEEPATEIVFGSAVILHAEIFDACDNMQMQWQFFDQSTQLWMSIEGATKLDYRYVIDESNCLYLWRLLITVPQEEEAADETVDVQDVTPEVTAPVIDEPVPDTDETLNMQDVTPEATTPVIDEPVLAVDELVDAQVLEREESTSSDDETAITVVDVHETSENQPTVEAQASELDIYSEPDTQEQTHNP